MCLQHSKKCVLLQVSSLWMVCYLCLTTIELTQKLMGSRLKMPITDYYVERDANPSGSAIGWHADFEFGYSFKNIILRAAYRRK